MKPSATGRILLWRGGSLWIGRAGEPAGFHAHHAVQIALPFASSRVRFRVPSGSWTSYDAAIVAAEQPHAFEARDRFMAQIFVEPESREGRELQLRYRAQGISELGAATLGQQIAALAAAYERRVSDADLIALASSAITQIAGSRPAPKHPGDGRVALAVEMIRARLGESISLSAIAAAVHLSPDRLCACNACPGAGCTCGCQEAAAKMACACGPQCACDDPCKCSKCTGGSKETMATVEIQSETRRPKVTHSRTPQADRRSAANFATNR